MPSFRSVLGHTGPLLLLQVPLSASCVRLSVAFALSCSHVDAAHSCCDSGIVHSLHDVGRQVNLVHAFGRLVNLVHAFSGDCSRLGDDDAKLWISGAIDPLHLVGILTVVQGSQTEPEIVVSQCYQSLYGPIVNLRRPSIDTCMSVATCFHVGRHILA